jgi:hypothetical protein
MSGGERRIPNWLRPHWEKKKQETARRITAAVAKLASEGRSVTFSSIREAVRILYGMPLSTNTIKRNEFAYEIYRQHRRAPKIRITRNPSLMSLYQESDVDHRAALQAKVARLRRESKDSLIARLIRMESQVSRQAQVENRLREEVTQISLKLLASQRMSTRTAAD